MEEGGGEKGGKRGRERGGGEGETREKEGKGHGVESGTGFDRQSVEASYRFTKGRNFEAFDLLIIIVRG